MKKNKNNSKSKTKNKEINWIITITLSAFFISMLFNLGAQSVLENVNIFVGVLIIILIILVGVVFDIIGVAVQSSDTVPFHSMASKKVKTAKTAKKMLKNSAKVSTFCNDVIGDVCGIISGSAVIVVSSSIALKLGVDSTIPNLLITSVVAALTIGGKAIGKGIAVNKSEYIITKTTKVLQYFNKDRGE